MLVVGLLLSRQSVTHACEPRAGINTELGIRKAEAGIVAVSDDGQYVVSDAAARYIRVKLSLKTAPAKAEGAIGIRDERGRLVQEVSLNRLRMAAVWSRRVSGRQVRIGVSRPGTGDWNAEVIESLRMPDSATSPYYSLLTAGQPGWQAASTAPVAPRAVDAVLLLQVTDHVKTWVCTGIAVSRSLILTNWHCGIALNEDARGVEEERAWPSEVAASVVADASWDGDEWSREYVVAKAEWKSKALDAALLRLAPVDDAGDLLPIRLCDTRPEGFTTPSVGLIHHPAGEPKQASVGCRVTLQNQAGWMGDKATEFFHDCDTEGGSSGGAVVVGDRLLGVHHLGFSYDRNCKSDMRNKAVYAHVVLEKIARDAPGLAAEMRHAE